MEGLGATVGHEGADGSHPHGHPILISAPIPCGIPSTLMPFHISTPLSSCLHCHPVAITAPSLFPSYCHGRIIPVVTFCCPIPIVTMLPPCPSFHLILIAVPCPPLLHCYPAPIATMCPSLSPLLPHPYFHSLSMATPSPLPLHPYFHPCPMVTSFPQPGHPCCHPILIVTSSPLTPCVYFHPISFATPSPWPPHPYFHPIPVPTPWPPLCGGC